MAILSTLLLVVLASVNLTPAPTSILGDRRQAPVSTNAELAVTGLERLPVKGRASQTGYSREQFGGDWLVENGCDTRNIILNRDLKNVELNDDCQVVSGDLTDPYTGKFIQFRRGSKSSAEVQIDHVVALSDAWQKGAAELSPSRREELSNDPLELLAVSASANQQKSGSDAASWLPTFKPFRCQYIARQIAVKLKYELWVTVAEQMAMRGVLTTCPGQTLPVN